MGLNLRVMGQDKPTDFSSLSHYTERAEEVTALIVYGDLVILLNFVVDLCLLIGANRLCGHRCQWKRVLLAAGLGSIYAAACLFSGFSFLGNLFWRSVVLVGMSIIAFGASTTALRRGILFVILSMALGGIAIGVGKGGFWSILASAGLVCLLCLVGFREPAGQTRYVPVTLKYQGRQLSITALLDTGNLLRDPITGESVLLVGGDVAFLLAGLTEDLLSDPIKAVAGGTISGGRLIPYRGVGQGKGMLLGLSLDEVWVDGKKTGRVVAFAPDVLSKGRAYQALTGGVL